MSRWVFGLVVALSLVVLFMPSDGVPSGIPVSDKAVHGTLFAALAFTGLLADVPWRRLLVGLVLYAAGSEVLQALLPIDRDGNLLDGLADVVGIAVGLVVVRSLPLVLARARP